MSITLKPETERLIQEEIRNGHFGTVDDLILQGVQAWREKNNTRQTLEERREAVARMQEFAEKNRTSVGDISVKDLIDAGRWPAEQGTLKRGTKTPAEAGEHIRQMRRGNKLPAGLTIRDPINEGRD